MEKYDDGLNIESKEKPPFLYHGTTSFGVEEFEPRKISTPGVYKDRDIPKAIYAGDNPAYCAAHSFSWGSDEGFDLGFEDDRVVFVVPEQMKNRLNVEVYVYKFLSDSFELLKDVEPINHNYWTQQKVKPVSFERFNSVIEAIEHFGGEVRYK